MIQIAHFHISKRTTARFIARNKPSTTLSNLIDGNDKNERTIKSNSRHLLIRRYLPNVQLKFTPICAKDAHSSLTDTQTLLTRRKQEQASLLVARLIIAVIVDKNAR